MIKPIPFLLALLSFTAFSSEVLAQTGVANRVTLQVKTSQTYSLPASGAEAIGLKCEDCVLENAYFVAGEDTVQVKEDTHADMAALVFLPSKPELITFFSGTIKGDVTFTFINAAATKPTQRRSVAMRTGNGDCEFEVVPTSVWRAGLAQPNYAPAFADTKVIAIHHGDSPNISTYQEAVNTVRNYYAYHTQSNGWSDIGYNFLIGPEGSIFQGREKLPYQTRDSDYIIGAHLCAKNTGAMGICMLGRFTNELPTAKALESLYKLIKWKADKDKLNIMGTTFHAGNTIPTVLGHRQGPCSTSCPGDLLFTKMAQIRTEASSLCNTPLGIAEDEMNAIVIVYPNPTQGNSLKTNFPYTTIEVFALDGKRVRPATKKTGETISTENLTQGTYFFHFDTPDYGKVVRRVVVQ